MQALRTTLGVLLSIVGAWLILNGVFVVIGTLGAVSGSEFGMLITLTNVVSSLAVWVGLFGLWTIIPEKTLPEIEQASEQGGS